MAGKRTEGSGKGGAKAAGKGGLGEVVLLSGGNPQIAKGYGDAPVQAYIAAMPGWKRAVGERLDALVARTVPGVYKAVKWNSPFYGFEGEGWFLSFHCMTKYIKVAFFAALRCNPCSRARQAEGCALPGYLRRCAIRRGPVRRLGGAGQPVAGRADVKARGPDAA